MTIRCFFAVLFSCLVGASPLQAHNANETYIYLQIAENAITGRFEAPIADYGRVFDLDADGDGTTTEAEFLAGIDRVNAALEQSLSFVIDGQDASITMTDRELMEIWLGPYAFLDFNINYTGPIPDEIKVRYSGLMAKALTDHRVLLLVESNVKIGLVYNEAGISLYFGPEPQEQILDLTGLSGGESLSAFIGYGFHNVLIEFVHVAFMVALLLPTVLIARQGGWNGSGTISATMVNAVSILALLAVGNVIALTLVATGVLRLPQRPVEILAVLSVVAAALLNLFAVDRRWMLRAVGVLGLVQGLSLANAMLPYGMARTTLWQSLAGFVIGVELAQLLIAACQVPVLLLIAGWRHYVRVILQGGSVVIIAVTVYLFASRAILLFGKLIG